VFLKGFDKGSPSDSGSDLLHFHFMCQLKVDSFVSGWNVDVEMLGPFDMDGLFCIFDLQSFGSSSTVSKPTYILSQYFYFVAF